MTWYPYVMYGKFDIRELLDLANLMNTTSMRLGALQLFFATKIKTDTSDDTISISVSALRAPNGKLYCPL